MHDETSKNDPLLLLNEQITAESSSMLTESGPHVVDRYAATVAGRGKGRLSKDVIIPSKIIRQEQQAFRRVPCKARGMSNNHNTHTAYFEIPVDAPHGLLLCCTHPECQVSARAFRYCKGEFER